MRLGDQWCLTADQSLDLYSGKTTVPVQEIIKSPKGHNDTQKLMYDTSLLVFQREIPEQVYKEPEYGLNLYPHAEALVYATPRYFRVEKIAVRTCLAMIRDAADILKVLMKSGASLRAGPVVGAFRNIGNGEIADDIVSTMRGFGYDVREEDPFEDQPRMSLVYEESPYVTRLRLMWENMWDKVVEHFPEAPGKIDDVEGYLRFVDEKSSEEAYHSLSMEGYKVSPELVEKVHAGDWKPETEDQDHKKCIGCTRGLLQREDLVGYRTGQVYIRGSQHLPLNPKAVRAAMPVYMDGNGRVGRFILNVLLASGGYNRTVVPVERRQEYMTALEKASGGGCISEFTKVIASLVK